MASNPLRILHLEDRAPDAERVAQILRDDHVPHTLRRVERESALMDALDGDACTLILARCALLPAERISSLRDDPAGSSDIPIVLLADASEERAALEALHHGATDYVLMHTLSRLPAVISRAMREAEERQKRREAENALARAQRMESMASAVGGIAHEFSNILNNVLGFTGLIKKYIHDRPKVLKYSQAIEQSVLRGDEVTQRLLAFAGSEKRAPEPLSLKPLMEEIAARLRKESPARVAVAENYDPELPQVLGVRRELQQALTNLCRNARDAILQNAPTGGRGTITLEALRTRVTEDVAPAVFLPSGEECVTLRVTDDGIGIPREIADRIFDPFFTTKETGRGAGLGLSIVYTIVRGHKGAILVDSSPGKGSTFRILLPIHNPLRPAPERRDEHRARKTELILLVDDELPMLEFGRDILSDHGYQVVTACDGVEALEIYRQRFGVISLVILDLIMPRMDGGQTYVEMKKINGSLKAMFCSGYTSDEVISSLLQEEHLRAVRKPFKITEFLEAVRETLDAPGD